MKMKYLFIFLMPFALFSQTYNVNVRQQKTIGEQYTDGMRAGAAARSARASEGAAQTAALANNSTSIKTDYLIDNDKSFRAVVLEDVSGWKVNSNTVTIKKILTASNKYIFYKSIDDVPSGLINNPQILYLNWIREAPTTYDRITTLILRRANKEVVFEATYKNVPHSEILSPLTTSYITSNSEIEERQKYLRADAIKKIKELKELLDMGILTQDEFDSQALDLKKNYS